MFNVGSPTGTTIPNLTLSNPSHLYVDNSGGILIADSANFRVLRWVNTVVTVVAGGRGNGGGLNQIGTSYGIAVDANSNIYVSDASNARVTLWTAGNTNTSQVVRMTTRRDRLN